MVLTSQIPTSPYDPRELEEVPLDNAPLVRVLCQVRHSALLSLASENSNELALRFAGRISDDYPLYTVSREAGIVITPTGMENDNRTASTLWRLKSKDEVWQVTFSKDFISLETAKYDGRNKFQDRLTNILAAYNEEINPPVASRIGLRFTNRIDNEDQLKNLDSLVRTELLGHVNVDLPSGVTMEHSFGQAQYLDSAGGLTYNWGLLPAGGMFDVTLPAVPRPSWVLDIDVFSSTRTAFNADVLASVMNNLAVRAYTCFRWSVKPHFLEVFESA
jgi:uncharacterized protein (TIGR04255 family)